MMRSNHHQDFAVPVANGEYAPEVVYLKQNDKDSAAKKDGPLDHVSEITLHLGTMVTGATVEVDLLRAGGDPTNASHWLTAAKSYDAAGLQDPIFLTEWRGVRVRAKSGGTDGTQTVSMSWI